MANDAARLTVHACRLDDVGHFAMHIAPLSFYPQFRPANDMYPCPSFYWDPLTVVRIYKLGLSSFNS
ncbi:hypothetical protein OF83DRAFT_310726 [Amylostereum chailletii]|nr:hypothetical protein OF83DRAFT_310726 [Amylostereum chailletii]